jgi:hypothetical protein
MEDLLDDSYADCIKGGDKFRPLHKELLSLYDAFLRTGQGHPKQVNYQPTLIFNDFSASAWQYLMGYSVDEPCPQAVTVESVHEILGQSDDWFARRREQLQKNISSFADSGWYTFGNTNFFLDKTSPLWILPLEMNVVEENPIKALDKFNSCLYSNREILYNIHRLVLVLQKVSFTTSPSVIPLPNILRNGDDSKLRYYSPVHELFVFNMTNLGWAVFIGVSTDLVQRNQDKILVPKNTVITEMTGLLRELQQSDRYQCEYKRKYARNGHGVTKRGVVITSFLAENRPLFGSVGFLVNTCCQHAGTRPLLSVIEQYELLKQDASEAPQNLVKGCPNFGYFFSMSLTRDLRGVDFLPSTEDELFRCTAVKNGTEYRLLPLETVYNVVTEEQIASMAPERYEAHTCQCLTRCWKHSDKNKIYFMKPEKELFPQ